jgi:hypothetical protein
MLDKIISGGQPGAEHAALRAARSFGIATGRDRDAGQIDQNVLASDATLWFGETATAGASATVAACQRLGKPCMPIDPGASFEPSHIARWIEQGGFKTLNVAGSIEQDEPGIGARVAGFLGEVLERLGHRRT